MSGKNDIKRFVFNDLIVEFETSELKDMVRKSLALSRNETGGIITGRYSSDRKKAIVKTFYGPTIDSKGTQFSFVRGKKGLSELLCKLWITNEYYLGEWHLHPLSSPDASSIDIDQMLKISQDNNYKCPEPILIIVGGTIDSLKYNAYVVIQRKVNLMTEIDL